MVKDFVFEHSMNSYIEVKSQDAEKKTVKGIIVGEENEIEVNMSEISLEIELSVRMALDADKTYTHFFTIPTSATVQDLIE